MRAGGLFLGATDEQLAGLAALGAGVIEDRHGDAEEQTRAAPLANPKAPPHSLLEQSARPVRPAGMSYAARIRLAQRRGLDLPAARTLARLRTPRAIQDFLAAMPQNFEPEGDTARSVQSALAVNRAHCIEGALIAAFALWLHGRPPLLIDLSAHQDMDHVLAPFKVGGRWGAISKTNYVCLRWRDPIYRSVRELVMSYFHEYAKGPRKTLRSYSRPFDLRRVPVAKWVNNRDHCWEIADLITAAPHHEIVTAAQAKALRPRDPVEVASDRVTAFPIPAWKRRRL
jgi:hypothetical protein